MNKKELEEAGTMAADYMYHFMTEELGSDEKDAVNAASDIYYHFTNEHMDVEGILGISLEDFEEEYD